MARSLSFFVSMLLLFVLYPGFSKESSETPPSASPAVPSAAGDSCSEKITLRVEAGKVRMTNCNIVLEWDTRMYCRAFRRDGANLYTLNPDDAGSSFSIPSHYVILQESSSVPVKDFDLDFSSISFKSFKHVSGPAKRLTLRGTNSTYDMEKILTVEMYKTYPDVAVTSVQYTNLSSQVRKIKEVWNSAFRLDRRLVDPSKNSYDFHGITLNQAEGNGLQHRIRRITASTTVPADGSPEAYGKWGGGGTPISTVWGKEMGMTVAYLEPAIAPVFVPFRTLSDGTVLLGVRETRTLPSVSPNAAYSSARSLLVVHHLDFFQGFRQYSELMKDLGAVPVPPTSADYQDFWCSYGIDEFNGKPQHGNPGDPKFIRSMIPTLKALELEMIHIDSGWDSPGGDFSPDPDLYGDENGFIDFIEELHNQGFKVSLWIDFGYAASDSEIVKKNPGWFVRKRNGSFYEDDWGRYQLDASIEAAREYSAAGARKMIQQWKVDRLMTDCAYLSQPNYAQPDPYVSLRSGHLLWKRVFDETRSLDSTFPIENCSCGAITNFMVMTTFSQQTNSDPDWLHLRPHEVATKTYKALRGGNTPVDSDHVEGSGYAVPHDYAFPLFLGMGNFLHMYFPKPLENVEFLQYKKYLDLHSREDTRHGEYLNLYDLAYDFPGTHAIRKGSVMYYAFVPTYGGIYEEDPRPGSTSNLRKPAPFSGQVELRGLDSGKTYTLLSYDTGQSFGQVQGPTAVISINIKNPLLLKATPVK